MHYQYLLYARNGRQDNLRRSGCEYTRRKVESGEFGSASEVIRDALRRAEERDRKIERLRQLIQEGEESGAPQTFDWDQFMESKFPDA